MKSVLLSVQPKWCELIAFGKKTVEVRKTKPNINTPFKCYIYCTQGKTFNDILTFAEYENGEYMGDYYANGKVIGEFVCDRVQEYESEFVDDDCYESIASLDYDENGDVTGFIEWSNDSDAPYISTDFFKKCCVKYEELKKYIGLGFVTFYGWHISDLVIYDKPKDLSEFKTLCTKNIDCYLCNRYDHIRKDCNSTITRPPQSWCYVERKED